MGDEWQLVGRDSELTRLRKLMTGDARGVLLASPMGVGKTRLASECQRMAERDGMAVARVTATRSASGLGAFAPLLPADRDTSDFTDSNQWVHSCWRARPLLTRGWPGGDAVNIVNQPPPGFVRLSWRLGARGQERQAFKRSN